MKLTPKQENFCNYYIETGNASEAYRMSYSCKTMKDNAINVQASKMLSSPKIALRVKELQEELKLKSDITKEEAIKELSNIVRARITKLGKIKGSTFTLNSLNDLSDDMVSAIQTVKSTNNGIEIKLYDKIAAVDRLSKMMGWDKAQKVDVRQILLDIDTGINE